MFKKFMEKNWIVANVRVYLWPFVFVAIVATAAPVINYMIYGTW